MKCSRRHVGVAEISDVERPVRDFMTSEPLAVTYVDTSPEEVVGLMERRHLRRIPVLDDRERVVGVLSSIDVSKRLAWRRARASDAARAVHEANAP